MLRNGHLCRSELFPESIDEACCQLGCNDLLVLKKRVPKKKVGKHWSRAAVILFFGVQIGF